MNLSRAQAQMAFVEGHKISHKYFQPDEFVYLNEHNQMIDENGITLNKMDFWLSRGEEQFDFGWFIFLQ